MHDIDARLARIESRLVQLMLHVGLNPYAKTYDARNPTAAHPTHRKHVPSRR